MLGCAARTAATSGRGRSKRVAANQCGQASGSGAPALHRVPGSARGTSGRTEKLAAHRGGVVPEDESAAELGNVDELGRRAETGDWDASRELAGLLRELGDVDELRRRADADDVNARRELAVLLSEQGELNEAIWVVRSAAEAGHREAREELERLLQRARGHGGTASP